MTSTFDGYNHIVRLEKGEKIIERLYAFAKENNIKGAWVVGLGAVSWAEVGWRNVQTKEYEWSKIEAYMELTNMTGNIAWKGEELILHMHATLSDGGAHARGGHLREAEIGATGEFFIHMWQKDGLNRSPDEETGLDLLAL